MNERRHPSPLLKLLTEVSPGMAGCSIQTINKSAPLVYTPNLAK